MKTVARRGLYVSPGLLGLPGSGPSSQRCSVRGQAVVGANSASESAAEAGKHACVLSHEDLILRVMSFFC